MCYFYVMFTTEFKGELEDSQCVKPGNDYKWPPIFREGSFYFK